MGLALMHVLERPPAVGIPVVLDDPDRLGDALLGLDLGAAQVFQPAQDVVEIPGREARARQTSVRPPAPAASSCPSATSGIVRIASRQARAAATNISR